MKKLTLHYLLISALCLGTFSPSYAIDWSSLWSRADEQGTKLLQQGKAKEAAQRFIDPEWRAVADYRAGHYKKAANILAKINKSRASYNRGNALARAGSYDEAIKAYNESLKQDPQHKDAKFNRDLLKKLRKQQQKQQNKQNQQAQSKQNKDNKKNKQQDNKQQQTDKQKKKNANPQQKDQNQSAQNNKDKQDKQKPSQQQANKQQSKDNKQQEQRQAAKQWLSRIPDDPGGLLRQKFLRDYQRMQNRRYSSDH